MAAKKVRKSASKKMSANKPPEPPPWVRGKAKSDWDPISRAPGQQRPGAGKPKMTTKDLDAYRAKTGFDKTVLPPAKGTGRSGGTVSRVSGMRGGFLGGLGSSGTRFGRK